MLILLDHLVADRVLSAVSGGNVSYRPELSAGQRASRGAELARMRPDALITRAVLHPAEAASWRAAAPGDPLVVVLVGPDRDGMSGRDPVVGSGLIQGRIADDVDDAYRAAFALAERTWLTAVTTPALTTRLARSRTAAGRSVVLVGAGVVNLVTGLRLVRDGYRVEFFDGAPDPRLSAHWMTYGSSRGGGDARMFTLTEADGYHRMADSTGVPFQTALGDGGWRIADPSSLAAGDLSWVNDNANIPPWLAWSYTEDILWFNRVAQDLWRELAHDEPALFGDVGLREGILRLYTDPHHLRAQVARQERIGALRSVLAPAEVAERYPTLRDAQGAGVFVGGIETVGFTLQVHEFLARLINLLEQAGAVLHWRWPVSGLAMGAGEWPVGLRTPKGVVRADHYVLSPGAYGDELLRGTASHGLIHGVLGAWVTVPNLAPSLDRSLKLSRTGHIAMDANVTVSSDPQGRPVLMIGSGYGWTGANPSNVDPGQLDVLYRAVENTAREFFPAPFEDARRSGLIRESRKFCVRPWTASSLAVLELMENAHGGLIIVTGGHNTGGFAQAPVVAEAVAATLAGRLHPMHTRYHPDRLRLFYRRR